MQIIDYAISLILLITLFFAFKMKFLKTAHFGVQMSLLLPWLRENSLVCAKEMVFSYLQCYNLSEKDALFSTCLDCE